MQAMYVYAEQSRNFFLLGHGLNSEFQALVGMRKPVGVPVLALLCRKRLSD